MLSFPGEATLRLRKQSLKMPLFMQSEATSNVLSRPCGVSCTVEVISRRLKHAPPLLLTGKYVRDSKLPPFSAEVDCVTLSVISRFKSISLNLTFVPVHQPRQKTCRRRFGLFFRLASLGTAAKSGKKDTTATRTPQLQRKDGYILIYSYFF